MPSTYSLPADHTLHAQPDIQLAALWQAVRRGFKGLAIVAAAVGATSYGILSLMAPRYTSESQLEFVSRRNNPLPEAGERPSGPDSATRLDPAAINTHARALLSSDLLLEVAGALKLRNRPEFNSAIGPVDAWNGILRLAGIGAPLPGETEDERVLAVIRRQLEVAAIKDTRSIAVRFSSTDNKLAADLANRLAETYRASLVTLPVEETSKAVEALLPKVAQLRKEVLDAEAEVERYRASSDQFRSGPNAAPVTDQRMAGLQDELLKAEAVRNETEARSRTAHELAQSGSAEVLPDVQKSALIQGLIQSRVRLERQIAEAAAALLPGHPRMRQLNADVTKLRRQIADEVHKVVQSMEKEARSATIRVDTVTRQIDQLKTKVVGQTGNEARLKELEFVARSKRTELERLQKQLEDNRTVVNIRQVPIEAQIIARAMPSATPTFPRKGPSTMLASAAALILGLAFVITKALVSTPAMAAAAAGPSPASPRAPVEPVLPEPRAAKAESHRPPEAPALRPAPAASAISRKPTGLPPELHALAHRLANRTDTTSGVRTLVSGETSGLDATPQALQLAEQLAAAGQSVVLVVWSLSGKHVPLARTALRKPGINDLLCDRATFEQVIGRMPDSAVHLIQPGSPPTYTSALLDPDRLNLTLDALDEAYEQIVVTSDYKDAQPLFEAIEGRFDAGVVVTLGPRAAARSEDGSDVLLGYEVTGIDVVRIAANAPVRNPAATTTLPTRASPQRGPLQPA